MTKGTIYRLMIMRMQVETLGNFYAQKTKAQQTDQ